MNLVYEITKVITINGREIEVNIEVHTEPEYEKPDFDYGNELVNELEQKRFKNGELENVCIRVQASFQDLIGTDYLGQCFMRADTFCQDVQETVDTHEMIESALRDLTGKLNKLLKKIGA